MMLSHVFQVIGTEWMWIIFLVIFLLFGSKKLPELSRAVGKAMGELQKGRAEIEREFKFATVDPKSITPKPMPKNWKTSYKPSGKFARAAEEMGLDSKGKSDDDLRKEIVNFLNDNNKKSVKPKVKQKTNTKGKKGSDENLV
jgi:sec-independent protein translocase protein TatA